MLSRGIANAPTTRSWSANLSAFLWARRLNNALSTRLGESFTEQDIFAASHISATG